MPAAFTQPCATRWLARVSALLVALSVTGCSLWNSSANKPVPADLGANVPVLGVRQVWTASLGSGAHELLEASVNGSVVTLASSEGIIAAIDARTGGDVWRTSVGDALSAGVGSDGRLAVVVTRSNTLVAIESGRERWRESLSAQVFTPPLVAGGRVFVLGADRSVHAFDASSGKKLWSTARTGESLVLKQSGVILAVGDTLLAGFGGRMQGLNPDNGSIRWEASIASARGANDVERLIELVGRTSRVGDSVCARAFQAGVGCISAQRGATVWSQPASGAVGVHGDADAVFGAESNGSLVAWSRGNGTRLWSSDRLKHRKLTAPLLLGRSVVVGDHTGLLHFVSRTDGAPLNRLALGSAPIVNAPVVAADTLVVQSGNGTVFGFRPE